MVNLEVTEEELNTLIEAVKTWEEEPKTSGALSGVMGSLVDAMSADRNENPEVRKRRMERARREAAERTNALVELRRETSVLLQAKLIQARKQIRP